MTPQMVNADTFEALLQWAPRPYPYVYADDAGTPNPLQYTKIKGVLYATPLRGVA